MAPEGSTGEKTVVQFVFRIILFLVQLINDLDWGFHLPTFSITPFLQNNSSGCFGVSLF